MTAPHALRSLRRMRVWALVLVAALAVSCSDDVSEPEPAPTSSATGTPNDEEVSQDEDFAPDFEGSVPMGQPVVAGRFGVRVDSYACDPDPEPQLEGGQLCQLTVEARNDTDVEQSIDAQLIVLLDEFATEYAAVEALGDADLIRALPAGEATIMVLLFQIPGEASIVAARLRDDPEEEGQLVDLVEQPEEIGTNGG